MKYWFYFFIIVSFTTGLAALGIFLIHEEKKADFNTAITNFKEQNNYLLEENLVYKGEVNALQEQVNDLQEELGDEIEKFDDLEDRVKDSLKTVEALKKISETDQELLQKYSKVFFLNEHYNPKSLQDIDSEYLLGSRQLQVKSEVWPFLEELLEDARDDSIDLAILSAYRSFDTQETIKQNYVITYGATAANTFSADQGYSEHQLGTAVDFTNSKIGGSLSQFKNTKEYEWLQDNAHRYGFTLSYPEGNSYYQFEPWHWRFVGKDLARYLDRKDLHFYDLDQRTINQYIVDLFED